jgi:hypothetical protein
VINLEDLVVNVIQKCAFHVPTDVVVNASTHSALSALVTKSWRIL